MAVNRLKKSNKAVSVSRRYYVGIASVDGSVFGDAGRKGALGVKVGYEKVKGRFEPISSDAMFQMGVCFRFKRIVRRPRPWLVQQFFL